MAKASRSGLTVQARDVPIILGMVDRGDRRHDIAAWFGLNQGRIKEVEDGTHGTPPLASPAQLPPSGSPGPKARALRTAVERARKILAEGGPDAVNEAAIALTNGVSRYDKNE